LNEGKLIAFPLRLGIIRQGYPLLPLLFNTELEVSARSVSQEKDKKGIQIGKEEVKLFKFTGDMILYSEKPNLKNKFSEVAECKINIQKIYINNEINGKK
jgi:hypothetical protein